MSGARWTMHWAESRVFDVNAIALGASEKELMRAAGAALAVEASQSLDDTSRVGEVWFLCGPGNNGGDGFQAAMLFLALSLSDDDIIVRVLASHEQQKTTLSTELRNEMKITDIPLHVWKEGRWANPIPKGRRVLMLVDCLLGMGSGGVGEEAKPRGEVAAVLDWLWARFEVEFPKVLACDIPTGLGSSMQMNADKTLTFHSDKLGHFSENGQPAEGVGGIKVASLPWPEETTDPGPGDLLRYPQLDSASKKGDRGRVLVVGGGPYHGAPLLAAMAAARMGADLIHVAMPKDAAGRAKWPLDIIPEALPDSEYLTKASLDVVIDRANSGRGVQSLVLGPGLGSEKETIEAIRSLLVFAASKGIPTVVDAEAILAMPEKAWLVDLIGVATPHLKEFKGWLDQVPPYQVMLDALRFSDWRENTEDEENAAIICTGPSDEMFGLGARYGVCDGGSARMAMGGTGDLLAGAIGGLLAIGMKPWPATRLAAYLMRRAGELAEKELGAGMVASDIPLYLAKALAQRREI